ncbi:MAG: hypothetical protein ACFFFH_21460 [Candidatus Thorarchaeota archaeon]
MIKIKQLAKIKLPNIRIRDAVIGAFIGGIFMIISAIITKPSDTGNRDFINLVLKVLDKNTGRTVSGVNISVKSLNISGETKKDGNFDFELKKNVKKKITILVSVPVDSFYLNSNLDSTGKAYETIKVKPK